MLINGKQSPASETLIQRFSEDIDIFLDPLAFKQPSARMLSTGNSRGFATPPRLTRGTNQDSPMHPLETYLQELRAVRSSGAAVRETSYYPALANLLNEVGKTLKPKVKCIIHLQDTGAGIPDGGLFTEEQIRSDANDLLAGAIPTRGAIEAKGTGADAWRIAESKQVKDYWSRYRQVLVTNYRDFLLVGADAEGNRAVLETYRLAGDEHEFWHKAAHPRAAADQQGESFEGFLKRVMLYQASLATPRDLAWFLASYAREAKFRIESGELPALAGIRAAMEEALGLKFEGARGDHFFRSALIQTLFYGIFSAWVLWSKDRSPTDRRGGFEWGMAARYLRVPILRKLFHEVSEPGQLETMNLPEVLNWAGAALNRVDRASFFANFEEGHAVQYFYEPFLEAFDPELRKDLGVWYTPVEVVKYMVARVDAELRNTLGVEDGLANPNVYILDPCCGTGAYLVEVLRKIAETLRENAGDALAGHDLKDAALERVFGFEILPAPFVVAHLQLGLLLQSLGAPLSEARHERARVFLTNALTGWEPVKHPKQLMFREMEEEREAAERVKRDTPILVILGNPPYNSFAGIANMDEERGLSEAYRTTKAAPAPQGQGLNDLYVRFFRMADRRIVEKTGKGIVSFISNYSWLDGLSFTGMRERYLEVFDHIWIDCLNGDKYKTGKLTPEGKPDPSIFSTEFNREGIQVGTAITLLARTSPSEGAKSVQFRHLWGKDKRDRLLAEATGDVKPNYQTVRPSMPLGLPFAPTRVEARYLSWPLLPELLPVSFPGVKTSRDDLVVDIDRAELATRMKKRLYPKVSRDEERTSLWEGDRRGDHVVPYCYRPFDVRWIYWDENWLDRPRPEFFAQVDTAGCLIEGRQRHPMEEFDRGYVTRRLADNLGNGLSSYFPLMVRDPGPLHAGDAPKPNTSAGADGYLAGVNADHGALFFHIVATLHCSSYRAGNQGALKQDWPRIPLPATKDALLASAALGREVAALLDPEGPLPKSARCLKSIAAITAAESRLDPDAGDLEITVGWGHAGKGGVTMPAKGRITIREMTPGEQEGLPEGATGILGIETCDVWLNGRAYWSNVPVPVWEYTLGGYQVIKKWLSYRERELLGRSLTVEEARYVTEMARRIAAIQLLGPALDANYRAVKQATFELSKSAKA